MMKYVCLLRGVNVGGNRKVPMAMLREAFERLGFTDVATYINSGNVIFSSKATPKGTVLEQALAKQFGFDFDVLMLTAEQVVAIAKAIPAEWLNDTEQKSDVLYLFNDADTPEIVQSLGYRPEFETIQYVPGALITNVTRKNQSKSSLLKLMGTPLYKRMTIRNVTTARKLAEFINR